MADVAHVRHRAGTLQAGPTAGARFPFKVVQPATFTPGNATSNSAFISHSMFCIERHTICLLYHLIDGTGIKCNEYSMFYIECHKFAFYIT